MGQWFIDDIISSSFSKVKLTFTTGPTVSERLKNLLNNGTFFGGSTPMSIVGYLVDDTINLGGTVNWADLSDESLASKAAGLLGSVAPSIVEVLKTGTGLSEQLLAQTIMAWKGCEKPTFDIGLLFVHTKNNDDRPETQVRKLLGCCYPKFGGDTKSFTGQLMFAPMGYTPTEAFTKEFIPGQNSPINGTCVLEIGEWFCAPGLLLQAANFDFSKECAPDGSPLWAQGKVTLTTCRMISSDEYLSWFIKAT